jgi:hypothetical protein
MHKEEFRDNDHTDRAKFIEKKAENKHFKGKNQSFLVKGHTPPWV